MIFLRPIQWIMYSLATELPGVGPMSPGGNRVGAIFSSLDGLKFQSWDPTLLSITVALMIPLWSAALMTWLAFRFGSALRSARRLQTGRSPSACDSAKIPPDASTGA